MVERNIQNHLCNLSVKLMFDILTPRPHFIIIQKDESRKLNPTENELNDLIELVTEFLTLKPQYDNNAILSFHRGKWYQQNHKHFHAHLCVPKKPYCQEAKLMITSETSNNRWSSSKDYLNRLNKDFILSKMKYTRYRDECLSMAYVCLHDPVSYHVPLEQFNTSKFQLVFLASSPQIGIIAKNINTDLKNLYNYMNHFYLTARKKLQLINPLYYNFGAHLCIHVSGKKKTKSRLIERTNRALSDDVNRIKSVRIVGYLQMDEELYLRWLPSIFHQIWLNEFQTKQHYVLT